MFVRLPHIRNSSFQRTMYIVCLFFVFSYIAFDVLDLDGSNLSSFAAPVERAATLAVISSDADVAYSFHRGEHAPAIPLAIAHTPTEYTRFQMTRFVESSLFASPRAHGYRIGLARDDLPN